MTGDSRAVRGDFGRSALGLCDVTEPCHSTRSRTVKFSREFIALTLDFACHVERIKVVPLEQALLHFTPLYLSFGLPRDFDQLNPIWRAFLAGLARHQEPVDWAYRYYLQRQAHGREDLDLDPTFGCFYYALWPENRVRIHFRNGEETNRGPLSRARRPQRLAELAAMFRHLRRVLPPAATVVGGSWLYNIEAYRSLYPPEFLASSRVGADEYQFIAHWGQFLDRHGEVRPMMVRTFMDRLARQASAEGLPQCFPYRVLRLESSIYAFYDFYGIR
jgi:hypothetical protein